MTTPDDLITATQISATLSTDEIINHNDTYWRACTYLAACMIYFQDNALLKERLKPEHIKNRLLGHWGQAPV